MKPETVEAVARAMAAKCGAPAEKWANWVPYAEDALAALTSTDEYKALAADAEIGRMFLKVAGRNRKEIQDTIEFWGMNRPDDSAIDAARASRE